MEFNSLKFELLRYGKNEELKNSTTYVTPLWELIESKEAVKDLGITMANNCSFQQHITNITESAKRMSAWVLRTFTTREKTPMMTLYKSLVRPLVEYSSALWTPISKADIKRLEDIQKSFIRKIRGVSRDYETALKELNLYSLELRRERYVIIHLWKMLENLVPNKSPTEECIIETQTEFSHRRGRTCKMHNLTNTPSHLMKARKQTLKHFGTKLFNNLPKSIRNVTNTTVDAFKSKLDKYLKSREDSASLSQAQLSWLETSRHVNEDNPFSPSLIHSGIEQHTPVFSINPVSGQSLTPASGQTVGGLLTQTT